MPRKDIWIRKEDLAKWEAIKDKPEFIHNALDGSILPPQSEAYLKVSPNEVGLRPPRATDAWAGPMFRDKKKSKL